jgi:hypothetical protein
VDWSDSWPLANTCKCIAGCCHLQGVRYTHRSNFLHALITTAPDALALSAGSTILMVVPMFHANSWGLNFSGALMYPAQAVNSLGPRSPLCNKLVPLITAGDSTSQVRSCMVPKLESVIRPWGTSLQLRSSFEHSLCAVLRPAICYA